MSLVAQNLRKAFGGVVAVDGLSFALAEGEIVALIGPNGAGKSTLFNLLAGQLHADSGAVFFEGAEISRRSPVERCRLGLGRTFQIAQVFASMTVMQNAQLALLAAEGQASRVWPGLDGLVREPALQLLEQVGLAQSNQRPASELAYGDVKRLEFALALAARPRLFLMDEPTAGMAPAERRGLMAMVVAQARARRASVLFTEHSMDVVFGHAERVLVMSRGRLIADGEPEAVRADAQVRAVYLGEEAA